MFLIFDHFFHVMSMFDDLRKSNFDQNFMKYAQFIWQATNTIILKIDHLAVTQDFFDCLPIQITPTR